MTEEGATAPATEHVSEVDMLRVHLVQAQEGEAALHVQALEAQLVNARRVLADRQAERVAVIGGVWERYGLSPTDMVSANGLVTRRGAG